MKLARRLPSAVTSHAEEQEKRETRGGYPCELILCEEGLRRIEGSEAGDALAL